MRNLINQFVGATWRLSRLWTTLMFVFGALAIAASALIADSNEVWRWVFFFLADTLYIVALFVLGWKAEYEDLA